jgi:hypothetical protein
MKNALKLSFILLSLFLTGCDSSDDFRMDDALLPKTIKTRQRYDAEPWYEYTHITTFEYDESNRPVTILKETYRRADGKSENVLANSVSRKLVYSLTEDMVTQTDFYETLLKANNYFTHTETRVYNIAPGNRNEIEITLDSKYKETIELSDGLAVKMNRVTYSDIPEEPVFYYTEEFKYNSRDDISQYTYSIKDYTSANKYEYDRNNGVYKHLNIPQWLFISLFGNEGRISNITDIYTSHDKGFVPLAKNINKYNSGGYVKEVEYRPDSEWLGIWGSKTTYEYIKANRIN